MFLMQRDGENIFAPALNRVRGGSATQDGGRGRWQDARFLSGLAEDKGSAVSLVNVAIDGHCPLDSTAFLHGSYGDGDVINHAEALAVIRESVVKATSNVDAYTILQRSFCRQDGPSRVQHKGVNNLWRVGNFHLQLFSSAEATLHQLVDVMRGVHQGDIGFTRRFGDDEIDGVSDALLKQTLLDEAVLVGAKDMLTDRKEILVAVYQLKGQHGPFCQTEITETSF